MPADDLTVLNDESPAGSGQADSEKKDSNTQKIGECASWCVVTAQSVSGKLYGHVPAYFIT